MAMSPKCHHLFPCLVSFIHLHVQIYLIYLVVLCIFCSKLGDNGFERFVCTQHHATIIAGRAIV